MDLAKYRNLFLEEATEHLAEMSRALLVLEKDPGDGEAIDLVFRMAHSIKGMAGSLEYDAITELSHALEDRMDAVRSEARVPPGTMAVLFHALEGLERMVGQVRASEDPPQADPVLLEALASQEVGAPSELPTETAEVPNGAPQDTDGLKKKA